MPDGTIIVPWLTRDLEMQCLLLNMQKERMLWNQEMPTTEIWSIFLSRAEAQATDNGAMPMARLMQEADPFALNYALPISFAIYAVVAADCAAEVCR